MRLMYYFLMLMVPAVAPAATTLLQDRDAWLLERGSKTRITECRCIISADYWNGVMTLVEWNWTLSKAQRVVMIDVQSRRVIQEVGMPFEFERGLTSSRVTRAVFDPQRNSLFLLVAEWATKHSLVRYDLSRGQSTPIGYAVEIDILRSGKYKGHLVALLRKQKVSSGMWYAYWLIDGDGQEIGYVGAEEKEKESFLIEQYDN